MSATTAPGFTMSMTEAAAKEIRRFVEGEAGLPETAGLPVNGVAP